MHYCAPSHVSISSPIAVGRHSGTKLLHSHAKRNQLRQSSWSLTRIPFGTSQVCNVVTTLLEDTRDMKNKLDAFFNTITDDDLPSISNNYLKSWPSYETIVGKSNEQRLLDLILTFIIGWRKSWYWYLEARHRLQILAFDGYSDCRRI